MAKLTKKKITMFTNGKISQFFKNNWRTLLFAFAVFAGILFGVWTCSKSTPLDIDANRNRVVIQLPKK